MSEIFRKVSDILLFRKSYNPTYNCQPSPPDAERAARRQRMRAALLQKNHAPRAATQYSPRLSRTPFFVTSLFLHTMACLRRLYVTVSP
jgi:hypothetical protein